MKKYTLFILICFHFMAYGHENKNSRADFFKNELNVSEQTFETIETIDNRYRSTYEKLNVEIQFRRSELNEVIKDKPFDEKKANAILQKLFRARANVKLNNIKHHLEIEKELDSFQRMKFNEYFSP